MNKPTNFLEELDGHVDARILSAFRAIEARIHSLEEKISADDEADAAPATKSTARSKTANS